MGGLVHIQAVGCVKWPLRKRGPKIPTRGVSEG